MLLRPKFPRPQTIVGYRKDGRPIYVIAGGSEPPAGDPTAADPPTPPVADPPASPKAGTWDGKVESLPEPVQKMIRDLRNESAGRRTALSAAEQKQQDMLLAIAKAAGVQLPGEQPDPGKLTEQLTQAQQAQRQTAVELAVYRTAGKHTADPDALLDSRTFLAKVTDLDPSAGDFADQVDTAIKQAVTDNPKLKAGRAPGASGSDHPGGSGEHTSAAANAAPGLPRLAAAYAESAHA